MTMIPLNVDQIARVCHEANRGLQVVQADPTISVAKPWDDISLEMELSVIRGVRGVLNGDTPEQSHQSWVDFKTSRGWTLGPIKDESIKQHPLLIPYDQLPADQQLKDKLFAAIVKALS